MSSNLNDIFFSNGRPSFWICLILSIATLAVYGQVRNFDFVSYDDYAYVTENRNVQAGLTLKNVAWAFHSKDVSSWHPLTWLSHMLDIELYGVNPGAHHLTNLFFHALNTLLLFLVFRWMTGALWRSAFVAALFALHPLHVESVAWVAERKDVLSTFFMLLVLMSYVWYTRRQSIDRYVMVVALFGLGLMAKPMLVTLPFVLLLLDFWPLNRFRVGVMPDVGAAPHQKRAFYLVCEKIPLLALSAAASIVTFLVQQTGGAVSSLKVLPLYVRIANALVSYVTYIGKMIWPSPLAVLYPLSSEVPVWQTIGSCLILILISVWGFGVARQRSYLTVGWLWYIGTLVPVIGLVQVGSHAMADRYTYVPLIGLFVMIAWGVPDLLSGWRFKTAGLVAAAASVISVLMLLTWFQIRYWKDSVTLYGHTLEVTNNNYVIHFNLGNIYESQNNLNDAVRHYSESIRIRPDFAEGHNNLGLVLSRQGKVEPAIRHYNEALRHDPAYVNAYINLGNALVFQRKLIEGLVHYRKALSLDADNAEAHNNIGLALIRQGKIEDAVYHFRKAVQKRSGYTSASNNLRRSLIWREKIDAKVDNLATALKIKPEDTGVAEKIKRLRMCKVQLDTVIDQFHNALTPLPGFISSDLNMANFEKVAQVSNEYDRVLPQLENTISLKPDTERALN